MTKFLDFLVLSTCKVSLRSEKKKGRGRGIIIIILTKIRIFTIVMVKINQRTDCHRQSGIFTITKQIDRQRDRQIASQLASQLASQIDRQIEKYPKYGNYPLRLPMDMKNSYFTLISLYKFKLTEIFTQNYPQT